MTGTVVVGLGLLRGETDVISVENHPKPVVESLELRNRFES